MVLLINLIKIIIFIKLITILILTHNYFTNPTPPRQSIHKVELRRQKTT